jgi:hypothetical protein
VEKAVLHTLKSDPAFIQVLKDKKPKSMTPQTAAATITTQILKNLSTKELTYAGRVELRLFTGVHLGRLPKGRRGAPGRTASPCPKCKTGPGSATP